MATKTSSTSDVFIAKESFTKWYDGVEVTIHAGVTRVRAGHPVLEGVEHLFEPLTVHFDVESATANPGEIR